MLRNYLIVAVRNFRRHKGYTFLNTVGLAVGLGACLIIFLYVTDEMGWDRYHADHERIYRVVMNKRSEAASFDYAFVPGPVAPVMKQDFPQVEQAARVLILGGRKLFRRSDELFYEETFFYADPAIFEVLTLPFIYGTADAALATRESIVLTEHLAEKYFGDGNPVGQALSIDGVDHRVTGVVADQPAKSHLHYDFILPMATFEGIPWLDDWTWPGFYTYVKLAPRVHATQFAARINRLADDYYGEELAAAGTEHRYFLQNIASIHLHSQLLYEAGPIGNLKTIYVFSAIGFLILIIAGVNFINLTTARAGQRANEMAMRKVVGARRSQLLNQLLGEALLMAFMAMLLAAVLVELVLPVIGQVTGRVFAPENIFTGPTLAFLLGITLFIGLAAGCVPAFVLATSRPVDALRSAGALQRPGSVLRRVLVVLQFTIPLLLLVATIIVYRQLNFMRGQPLGFEKQNRLVIPTSGGRGLQDGFEAAKAAFSGYHTVEAATASSGVPGRIGGSLETRLAGAADDHSQMMNYLGLDHDYLPTFDIQLLAGRNFAAGQITQDGGGVLINATAARALGFNNPREAIGQRIFEGFRNIECEIIGVTADFHYYGLQQAVEPLVMEYFPGLFGYITLAYRPGSADETLQSARDTWSRLFPEQPFEAIFLDSDFDNHYATEVTFGRLLGAFTILGQIVACLGLLGLVAHSVETRQKEIGIRKVLGATVTTIVTMISGEFVKLVLWANLLAAPLAWYAMHRWLADFAYRVEIGLMPFVTAALVVVVVALSTVSYQAVRAAIANPVDAIRYE